MRLFIVAAVSWLMLCTIARGQPLADRVPDDAIVYIGWVGSERLPADYENSHLKSILDNSRIREFFTQFMPQAGARVARENPEAQEPIRIVSAIAPVMWKHPTALFAGVDLSNPHRPVPKVGLLCDARDSAEAVHREIEGLLQQLGPTPVPVRTTVDGGLVAVLVGYADGEAAVAGGAGPSALGQSPAFQGAFQHVQSNPVTAFYLDTEKLIREVEAAIQALAAGGEGARADLVSKSIDATGLRGLKRIVGTSGFDGQDWMSMTFVEAPAPRTGLLSMLEPRAMSPELLSAIPPDATFVTTRRLDAARLIAELRTSAGQVHPEAPRFIDMGLGAVQIALARNPMTDILQPMGEDWALYCSPSVAGNGLLGLVAVNRLDDPAKAQQALPAATINLSNWLAVGLRQARAPVEVRARHTKIGDQTIYYLGTPALAPAWTIKGDHLYIGLFPQSVVSGARAGGRDDASFADSEKYKALMKRLDIADPVSFSLYDLPATAGQGMLYQRLLLISRAAGAGDLFGVPLPEPLLPPLDVLQQHLSIAGSASWIDDAGYHVKAVSPFPGSLLLSEPGVLSGATPMLAAMSVGGGLPAIFRARAAADETRVMLNLRRIGMIIQVHRADNADVYPEDLESLAMYMLEHNIASADSFLAPGSGTALPPDAQQMEPRELATWLAEYGDYAYVPVHEFVENAAQHVVMYQRAGAGTQRLPAVLFADGHVERINVNRLRALLEAQGEEMEPLRQRR